MDNLVHVLFCTRASLSVGYFLEVELVGQRAFAFVISNDSGQWPFGGVELLCFPTSKILACSFPIALPREGCQALEIFVNLIDETSYLIHFVSFIMREIKHLSVCSTALCVPFLRTVCPTLPFVPSDCRSSSFLTPLFAHTRAKSRHPSLPPDFAWALLTGRRGWWAQGLVLGGSGMETKSWPLGRPHPHLMEGPKPPVWSGAH